MCHSFSSTTTAWSVLVFVLTIVQITDGEVATCGGFIDASLAPSGGGTIKSPNYPASYPNETNCIWLVQGPGTARLRFTLHTLSGEEAGGQCTDYLEVRAGSSVSALLYRSCFLADNNTLTVDSHNQWLWIKFYSNDKIASTGFTSTWNTTDVAANASYPANPVIQCSHQEYWCGNKECIEWSYICDGIQDCGCWEFGCDEADCEDSKITPLIRFTVGVSVGIVTFVLAVFFTMWSEHINPWPPFKKKMHIDEN